MKDLQTLTQACHEAIEANLPLALATVVTVEGSAYRRPGARMLISPDGRRIGTVSGGCLEADVVERASQVMTDGAPQYIRYDAHGENGDVVFELGCRGAIGILIERAADPYMYCHLQLLAAAVHRRDRGALATVFDVEGVPYLIPGTRWMRCTGDTAHGNPALPGLIPDIDQDLLAVTESRRAQVRDYALPTGRVGVLIEPIAPPPALLLCGAGEDAIPLAALAHLAGWEVSVADPRTHLLTPERFPGVAHLLTVGAEEGGCFLKADDRTAVVLMTHSYAHDLEWLRHLLPLPLCYLGLLGPRKRSERMIAQLQEEGIPLNATDRRRLHTPTGLDIGSETPEEIALAIVAEIQAVLNGRAGGFLSNRVGPIHATTEQEVSPASVHPPLAAGDPMSTIGLILLAAGASVRMGEPKQLLLFQGQTLLRRAAETALASSCSPVIVVLGAHSPRLLPELAGLEDVHIVENPDWEQGMGSSIRVSMTALLSAPHPEVDAVVLMLCDQPLLTTAHLNALIEAYEVNGSAIIASEYAETLGVPALFPRALFPELFQLAGTAGARQLLLHHHDSVVALPFPEGALDLDTPEDYVRILPLTPI